MHLSDGSVLGKVEPANIVSVAWDFKDLRERYEAYLDFLEPSPPPLLTMEGFAAWYMEQKTLWDDAFGSDPLLPLELLPDDYLGREAWQRRRDMHRHIIRRA